MRHGGVLLSSLEPDCMTFLQSDAEDTITNSPFSLFEVVSKYFDVPPFHVSVFLARNQGGF